MNEIAIIAGCAMGVIYHDSIRSTIGDDLILYENGAYEIDIELDALSEGITAFGSFSSLG